MVTRGRFTTIRKNSSVWEEMGSNRERAEWKERELC